MVRSEAMNVKKKILLIEPPFYRLYHDHYSLDKYPLAMGYLAGMVLRETDWDVRVFNADFNPEFSSGLPLTEMAEKGYERYIKHLGDASLPIWSYVESKIREYAPDVIGISCKTQNYASAKLVMGIAKKLNPEVKIIVGGPHPSMAGEQVLETPEVDVAVVGEGEKTLVGFLMACETGAALNSVHGIIFRRDDGQIIRNPSRAYLQDLDELPFPHESAERALIDFDRYPKGAFRYIFATRGCPYACQFCGSRKIWSRKVRYRSSENVGEEIARLWDFGLRQVHFDDDTFGLSKKYIQALCAEIQKRTPEITWGCETTVNVLNDETIRWMKDSGCHEVYIGVESGNNEMLRAIRKNITIEKAIAAAEKLRKTGITVQTFFMAGFPDETEKTMADTMAAMRKIKTDNILFSIYTPYPGTEGYQISREKGMIDDSYDVTLYNHQNLENCFTSRIAPERFRPLVKKMMHEVDVINTRRKRYRTINTFWNMGVNSLRRNGIFPTMGKTMRVIGAYASSRLSHKRY